ncbi:MAG: hypothetical protein CMQ74_00715 [Gammaproteobacteria bacterium]|nr:hypothetical protein [Gammaproteobacteria bacterium]|tara:strand:+ start:110 stop:685 length:576 start_codon:yes stop_codon:yes gene_type:complete
MGASTLELYKTPLGEARWFKCLGEARKAYEEGKPDEWSLELLHDENDGAFKKWYESMEDKFYELHGSNAKKNTYWFNCLPDKEDSTKSVTKFKKTCWVNNNGTKTVGPNVIDSTLEKWPINKEIGNGSKIIVGYTIRKWSGKAGCGMSFDPVKIMVMDYVEYSGGPSISDDEFFGEVQGGYSLKEDAEKSF